MIEQVRRKLRSLIRLIEKDAKNVVYTSFVDVIAEHTEIDIATIIGSGAGLAQYRKKVEAYIKCHEDQLTIQKLKRNKPISQADLEVFENLLLEASGVDSREEYNKIFHNGKPLGVFVRELVGLDRGAAKEELSEYLDDNNFNPKQIEFINLIIDYLTMNGIMKPARL